MDEQRVFCYPLSLRGIGQLAEAVRSYCSDGPAFDEINGMAMSLRDYRHENEWNQFPKEVIKPKFWIGEELYFYWESAGFQRVIISKIIYSEAGISYEVISNTHTTEISELELMTVDEIFSRALTYIKHTINELERLKKEVMK